MTTLEESKSWKGELKEVWAYATTVTTALFFTSTLIAWFVTWQVGATHFSGYVLAAVDPALASLFMILICLVRPVVFSGRQFAFPHTFALPTVFIALIYGFKLLSRDIATIQRYETIEKFDLIWLDPSKVLFVWIGMILVLSAIGVFKSKTAA